MSKTRVSNSVSNSVRRRFAARDIQRGDAYASRRINALKLKDGHVTATVRGQTGLYDVTVELQGREVHGYYCDCPKFHRTDVCKHVWAVLRKLDVLASTSPALFASASPVPDEQLETPAASSTASTRNLRRGARATRRARSQPRSISSDRSTAQANLTVSSANLTPAAHRATEISSATELPIKPPAWLGMLQSLGRVFSQVAQRAAVGRSAAGGSRPFYMLRLDEQGQDCPRLQIFLPDSSLDAQPVQPTSAVIEACQHIDWQTLQVDFQPDDFVPADQRIIRSLHRVAAQEMDDLEQAWRYTSRGYRQHRYDDDYFDQSDFKIGDAHGPYFLQDVVATGRLLWQLDPHVMAEPIPVQHWISQPLIPHLIFKADGADQWQLTLELRAGERCLALSEIVWAWDTGHVLCQDSLGLIDQVSLVWLRHFMSNGSQSIADDQRDGLIAALVQIPQLPEISWPEQWQVTQEIGAPQLILKVHWPERIQSSLDKTQLAITPVARYGQTDYTIGQGGGELAYDPECVRIVHRDAESEWQRFVDLLDIEELVHEPASLRVQWTNLRALDAELQSRGWAMELEGRPLVPAGAFSFEVTSGVDWFDLSGGVAYANQIVPIPALLQAAKKRERFIALEDGSHGLLPTDWIERFGKFLELAQVDGDVVRFSKPQAMLLDSLLREQDESRAIRLDAGFRGMRRKLEKFAGVNPAQPPATFQGQLREYQQEGLGWFGFLREFGFGGCLADDMGLGKTVQVLALLEQRRGRRLKANERKKPSLLVVPKSLIFNWIDEAQRFAPRLRVVNYTGIDRDQQQEQLATADVVLTTYGTLRNDIEVFAAMEFDYAILDEAQAIKNPQTGAAKACYVVQADHRLTMTGTPVENHLGDLWSQFRFLNPGLLGHSQAFAAFGRSECDEESLQQLSTAVRPFILRRTKQQVLTELPEKTEQTLFCEMSAKQARQYNELRNHYRSKLGETVRQLGLKRSKIQVLEALLRLRQAACDGRLINSRTGAPGTKLETLAEQLQEVLGEGHKVLVFSQFTSFLELLKKDLKKKKIRFEYLDGKTTDRRSPVARFQNEAGCQLFLISLKAGGQGLNLTAADYVYILDPWWNPAVEAQAIDRAHRLGQTKRVFAYRMITRGTVEEKIVELQKSKRELADAIISGNNSLIRSLTADDLKMLLD